MRWMLNVFFLLTWHNTNIYQLCDLFLFILAFILVFLCILVLQRKNYDSVQLQKLDKFGIILYISPYSKRHYLATSNINSWFFLHLAPVVRFLCLWTCRITFSIFRQFRTQQGGCSAFVSRLALNSEPTAHKKKKEKEHLSLCQQ